MHLRWWCCWRCFVEQYHERRCVRSWIAAAHWWTCCISKFNLCFMGFISSICVVNTGFYQVCTNRLTSGCITCGTSRIRFCGVRYIYFVLFSINYRDHSDYWHQIPIGARAGQNWVAKVLRLGVSEWGAVATSELPSRLGRTILGRAFAATWGRLLWIASLQFTLRASLRLLESASCTFLLWIAFFWRSKRKYLAKGETLWIQNPELFITASFLVVLPLRDEYNLQLFNASVVAATWTNPQDQVLPFAPIYQPELLNWWWVLTQFIVFLFDKKSGSSKTQIQIPSNQKLASNNILV